MEPQTRAQISGFLDGVGSLFGGWLAFPRRPPAEIARILNRSASQALHRDWVKIGQDLSAAIQQESQDLETRSEKSEREP